MKLNPDCVRDVMLGLEEELQFTLGPRGIHVNGHSLMLFTNNERVRGKYSKEDVLYSVIQLSESGYICAKIEHDFLHGTVNVISVLYVTPKGHEFITRVQDDKTWSKKISPALKLVGSVSLSIIEAVAKGATNSFIDRVLMGQTETL